MKNKVLIVDDSRTLRASVSYYLSQAGFQVDEAIDGEDGLNYLRRISPAEAPALIITDINMPKKDGIAFIQEVKKTEFKYIPIVVLTTENQDDKKEQGRAAGAAGWMTKPFDPKTLLWVVKKFVRTTS